MNCLVKIYDREQINNIVSILSFSPQKVILIYDKNDTKLESLTAIEDACIHKIPQMNFEFSAIDGDNLEDISQKSKNIIRLNPDCYFDITGGGELCAIGVYLACTKSFTPIFKIDVEEKKIINIYGCNHLAEKFSMPDINIETLLMGHGATMNGYFHISPNEEMFDSIMTFCSEGVFKNVQHWKDLCLYIQGGLRNSSISPKSLFFSAPKRLSNAKGKFCEDFLYLLQLAQNLKLINNLTVKLDKVEFSFKDSSVKKYMTDFGIWLELYVYVSLKRSKLFKDVRLSVRVGWDGIKQDRAEVLNEIDVTFFNGIHPVFVSCKLSEPSTEALQEVSMYPNYFGGRRSKCIIVTLSNIKSERTTLLRRANQMGIDIVDGSEIRSGKLLKRIDSFLKAKKNWL